MPKKSDSKPKAEAVSNLVNKLFKIFYATLYSIVILCLICRRLPKRRRSRRKRMPRKMARRSNQSKILPLSWWYTYSPNANPVAHFDLTLENYHAKQY
jgi:hypothetical protein